MLDTVYMYTAPAAQVLNVVIGNLAQLFFFQMIEERFRLPPSSEMHILKNWGE